LNAVCTIVTPNYVPFAAALHESLNRNIAGGQPLHVFVSTTKAEAGVNLPEIEGLRYLFLEDLCSNGNGLALKEKYLQSDVNAFRWAMKSVLLKYLLTEENYDKALFLDGDLFFYANYQLIWDSLDRSTVVITPHWRSRNPTIDPQNFSQLMNKGIYNAGFIGVNKNSIAFLDWWFSLCLYKCALEPDKGYYGDQAYFNLFHVYFEGVEAIRHRGYNVANWNRIECERVLQNDGQVLINGKYPIVFIHFTANTMRGILTGKDPLLRPHLELYASALRKFSPEINIIEKYSRKEGKKETGALARFAKKLKTLFR
jgi:hypothetical protein